MKTIVVDHNSIDLQHMLKHVSQLQEVEVIGTFAKGKQAIEFAWSSIVDLAILNIQMPEISGIELGKMLQRINPNIILIFVTAYEEYAIDALRLWAVGYLMKPYSAEDIMRAVKTAALLHRGKRKRIFIRTFGHFDVFVDGKPIIFRSGKAKELLALLVDRHGGTVNTEQVIAALWGERPCNEATQNLCYKTGKTMVEEMREHGLGNLLMAARGVRSIDVSRFDCDLYRLLAGDQEARKQFLGEYMVDYSWGEERSAVLSRKYFDN